MIRRLLNYIVLLLATITVWFVQPSVDAFLRQRGWDQTLNRALDSMPTWNWWTTATAVDRLPTLSPFWAGAFAVLAIWGTFELYYVFRRRRARRLSAIQAALPEGLNYVYVHFLPETGEIVDSYNITSVGHGGSGDFKLTLAEPLDPRTLSIHPVAGSAMPTEWLPSPAGDSIQVKYRTEPEVVRLRFVTTEEKKTV